MAAARAAHARRLGRARRTAANEPRCVDASATALSATAYHATESGIGARVDDYGHCRVGDGRLFWPAARDCRADNGIDCVVANKKGAGQVWRKTVCDRGSDYRRG